MRIGSGLSPHSSAGPASALRFASERTGPRFDTTEARRSSRASDEDAIPVHLSHGSHSNGMASESDRAKNEEEKEEV